jgi:hypothetical protein
MRAVEKHRACGARRVQGAVDERVAGRLEDLGGETMPAQHRPQMVGVPADVRLVSGDVRDRQQLEQLGNDLFLMRADPCRHTGFQIAGL